MGFKWTVLYVLNGTVGRDRQRYTSGLSCMSLMVQVDGIDRGIYGVYTVHMGFKWTVLYVLNGTVGRDRQRDSSGLSCMSVMVQVDGIDRGT